MRTGRALLAGLAIAVSPALAAATDAPHDESNPNAIGCQSCHRLHGALGSALTTESTNFALCASCHNAMGVGLRLGFPWYTDDQAVPGTSGAHHRWDSSATSAAHGALPPLDPEMSLRLAGGTNLECSTCHDQHAANPAFAPGSVRASVAVGTALASNPGTGSGTLTVNALGASPAARGYLLDVVTQGSAATARFRVSSDGGTSWFGWSGAAWVPYDGTNGRLCGTAVPLTDPAVTVTFTGGTSTSFRVGDRWRFYVSYAFLRASNVGDAMCLDCHRDRSQSSVRVEGADAAYLPDGVRQFSHPIGEGLARSYDRTGAILDANGGVQGSAAADANATNDLRLDGGGRVRCTSCHAPHGADSNSLSEDVP